MKNRILALLTLLAFGAASPAWAQVPTVQDCLGAISICNFVYQEQNAYSGTGNYLNEITPGLSCLGSGELNDVWYIFTVQNPGELRFTITPNNLSDDYDWAVYNLTEASCADIATTPGLEVSCNYSGTPGITGPNGLAGDQNNPPLQVLIGQTYVINVSQFSSSPFGYTINFAASTATIFDEMAPEPQIVTQAHCGASRFQFRFSENVRCGNLDPTDFSVLGGSGGYQVLSIESDDCQNGAEYSRFFWVELNKPLVSGNFSLTFSGQNSDLTDLCGNVASAKTITFNTTSVLTLQAQRENLSCFEDQTGKVTLSSTNGSGTINFSMNGGGYLPQSVFQNLSAGAYTFRAQDQAGCLSPLRSVTISQPNKLLLNTDQVEAIRCKGDQAGNIRLAASGGTTPYQFSFDGGLTFSTTSQRGPVGEGIYEVAVRDAKQCLMEKTLVFQEPDFALRISQSKHFDVACKGDSTGRIELTASGGLPPYRWAWSDGQSDKVATELPAGIHSVSLTDSLGCVSRDTFVIEEPQNKLEIAQKTLAHNPCHGQLLGRIDLVAQGGTGEIGILWSNSLQAFSLEGLAAGAYIARLSDQNGCELLDTSYIRQPAAPLSILALQQTEPLCHADSSGILDLVAQGGTLPATFLWTDGATEARRDSLPAGVYTVLATDSAGCQTQSQFVLRQPAFPLEIRARQVENPSCSRPYGGLIDLETLGGTGAASISWEDQPLNSSLRRDSLPEGIYRVWAEDSKGCRSLLEVELTQPDTLRNLPLVQDVRCHGANDGSVAAQLSGGTAPFRYLWDGQPGPAAREGLAPGQYVLEVRDAASCFVRDTLEIRQPSAPLVAQVVVDSVSCHGLSDGRITLIPSGGTAPHQFVWADGQTDSLAVGLPAGRHDLQVVDSKGCQWKAQAQVRQPEKPLLLRLDEWTMPRCKDGDDGSIQTTLTGGSPPYQFLWSDGTQSADNLSATAGSHRLLVTDSRDCQAELQVFLPGPETALELDLSPTHVACNGAAQGAIDLSVSGGYPPYAYLWSNGVELQNVNGLSPGFYSVTVTDANACSRTDSVQIYNGLDIQAQATSVSCKGLDNGQVAVQVQGGIGPYSYLWSDGSPLRDRQNLAPGSYRLTVTDQLACSSFRDVRIFEPTFSLSADLVGQDVACHGDTTGRLELLLGGGTLPYQVLWGDGASDRLRLGLSAGDYQATITDANGCETSVAVTLAEPAMPLAISHEALDIACHGQTTGRLAVTASGGTAPYRYAWADGSNLPTRELLPAGSYELLLTDSKGCRLEFVRILNQPESPLSNVLQAEDLRCHADSSGQLAVTPQGGTSPWNIAWDDGPTEFERDSLPAGTYGYVLSDAHGCTLSGQRELRQPFPLAMSFSSLPVSCFGGSDGAVGLFAQGGTPPLSWQWESGNTSEWVGNLPSGFQTASLTDVSGCALVDSVWVPGPESPLTLEFDLTNVACFGELSGSIDLSPTGGTGPYRYQWSNGQVQEDLQNLAPGYYQVSVLDRMGCGSMGGAYVAGPSTNLYTILAGTNPKCSDSSDGSLQLSVYGGSAPYSYAWNHGSTEQDPENLGPGRYEVLVTDSLGCAARQGFTLTAPFPLGVDFEVQDVLCHGESTGSIKATASGGTMPYTVIWQDDFMGFEHVNLGAGQYAIKLTDRNGCILSDTLWIQQPESPLSGQLSLQDPLCNGQRDGWMKLDLLGGTSPYNFLWSNGSRLNKAVSLGAGPWSVLATDANGCAFAANAMLSEPPPLLLAISAGNPTCSGVANGWASLSLSGGTPEYSLQWSEGQTTAEVSGLSEGWHDILATDANGCLAMDTFLLESPSPITTRTSSAFGCFGTSEGRITLEVFGGTPGYDFLWSNGSQEQSPSGLGAGDYSVLITDEQGCQAQAEATVAQADALRLDTLFYKNQSCTLIRDAEIAVAASGGLPPYQFQWTDSAYDGPRLSALLAGSYVVTVSDQMGCSQSLSFDLRVEGDLCIELSNAFTPNGDGFNERWEVPGLALFPDARIEIFDRYGRKLAELDAANNSWDGTFSGNPLPTDTYFYLLYPNHQGQAPSRGTVTLVR